MRKSLTAPIVAAALLVGCVVGPNYHRPAIQAPNAFRAAAPATASNPVSLADLKWFEVFKDEKLQELERAALAQNYDLRDAVARVEAARAVLGITRSNQFPNLGADADISTIRFSRNGATPLPASFVPSQNRTFGGATLNLLSFELDFWGRFRRATEAAPANLLGPEENRKPLMPTLVTQVRPLAAAPASSAAALKCRGPVRCAAAKNLISANAEIGVAKASYFPQISLTGFLGGQGTQLSSLFSGPSAVWNFAPQVTQPIFTAGRIKSNVKLQEALRDSALLQYEKSIQTAFTEVSDALIAHQRVRESRIQQELLVAALQDRTRLAYVRYRGGVDTLLNALDSDRDLFQSELTLSQIRLNDLESVVQLYKALGGGWQA